jgi:hypothetical protein
MKIEYVESKREYPKLCEIPAGTVFSPTNSIEIYIKLDRDGLSDIFTDSEKTLKRDTLNIQGLDDEWEDYGDIIAVAHLKSGTLAFINRETRVNPLDCKLVVEE